jgi:hypothetical protein
MGNIRNRETVARQLWDWQRFNSCFSRGARPSDIDGVVEIDGKLLVLEGKPESDPGEWLNKRGQCGVLDWHVAHGAAVLVLWGNPDTAECSRWCHLHRGKKIYPCTTDEVHGWIKRWHDWARSNGP